MICPICKKIIKACNRKKIRKRVGNRIKTIRIHRKCKDMKEVIKVDMNKFAREVTLAEGQKESVSIAQVKEILRITFEKLATLSQEEVMELVKRYKK